MSTNNTYFCVLIVCRLYVLSILDLYFIVIDLSALIDIDMFLPEHQHLFCLKIEINKVTILTHKFFTNFAPGNKVTGNGMF